MGAISADELARITNFSRLVDLLRDKLDWPIGEDYGFEDVVFEYAPGELGLKPEEIAKIREIHQLRPLVDGQPWGIFFVSFEEKTISITVLRRMLRALVVKKRAGSAAAERQTWQLHDLIFAANFGKSGERELAIVHFSDESGSGDLPVLKVLGWNAKDTFLHNDHVARVLSEKLRWPDEPDDKDEWRASWSAAFETRHNEVIQTSKDLAIRLASLATDIRARANQLLKAEADDGAMRKMLEAFRKNLIQDLDEDGFADMFAQTIAYGLLAARISRPSGALVADNLTDMVPKTNPFLRELFETFLSLGGRDKRKEMDFDELGVRNVVDMLARTNMEAVLRDFGDRNPKEDPVIHFYELFLKEYDPQKRMQRGVFYTPRPVVNFIVRGVDEILRTEFDLPLGLADTTTWAELAARNDKITVPEHVDPNAPFVQILDPATGTGTFLVEVIELIHKSMIEHWKTQKWSEAEIQRRWNEYVPRHLLPRLTGFELMMAPYAIAHMKIGLKLVETGYRFGSDERAHVFLTNALEPARDLDMELAYIAEALAHEAAAANDTKRNTAFSVVIGNPPYANYSANLSPSARRIVDRYRAFKGVPIRERNQLQFERNLQDDFVKFIARAQDWIEYSSRGIVGYITNAAIISSSSLRGAREDISRCFSDIRELHLHGGGNEQFEGSAHDENVFDIVQSVSINIYSRSNEASCGGVCFANSVGSRVQKYDFLGQSSIASIGWDDFEPDADIFAFLPSKGEKENQADRLDAIFSQYGAGIKTNRDGVVIGFTRAEVLQSIQTFLPYLVDSAERSISEICYRPFDLRYIFYHKDVVASMSWPTMQHVLNKDNIGLITCSTWTTAERFSVGVANEIVEMKSGTHDRGTTFFPLYRHERILDGEDRKVHNLEKSCLRQWREATGLTFVEVGRGDLKESIGPEDVLRWLYALFHSPQYRLRFSSVLSRGFPVVLIAKNNLVLADMADLGRRLIALHLLKPDEAPVLESPEIRFAGQGEARVERGYPKYENGKVMINATRWFEDVPKATWDFHVGGYPVCKRWLKDRAGKGGQNPRPGRVLTDEDILHYRRVVVALTETRRIMTEIDRVIDDHGGWPGAFASSDT